MYHKFNLLCLQLSQIKAEANKVTIKLNMTNPRIKI